MVRQEPEHAKLLRVLKFPAIFRKRFSEAELLLILDHDTKVLLDK